MAAASERESAYPDFPAAEGPEANVMAGIVGAGSPDIHGMPP